MNDINDYVGIPWLLGGHTKAGADCWGLTLMVLYDCFGINVNRFIGSTYTGDQLAKIIDNETNGHDWVVAEKPISGDVCIMKSRGSERPEHIGIFSNGLILHALGQNQKGVSVMNKPAALLKIFSSLEYHRFVGNNNCSS